jgi:hypothetical protein
MRTAKFRLVGADQNLSHPNLDTFEGSVLLQYSFCLVVYSSACTHLTDL